MNTYRLGRLPATRPHGLSDMATYAAGKLPQPPAQIAPPAGIAWGMDGNDRLGDCVMAGCDHLIAAWDGELGRSDARPTEDRIEGQYFQLTGGSDTGLNEASVLTWWQRNGLWGNQIAAFAPVQPSDIIGLHQAIAFYGGAMLGIQCPQSAQQQAASGLPWTVVPGSPVVGGHCIVAVGYDQAGLLCVSWGQLVHVSWPFVASYMDEAWCVVSQELVEAKGDSLGIDLETLQADLSAL